MLLLIPQENSYPQHPFFFFLEAPVLNEIEFPLFIALILKIFILPLALQKEIGGQTVLVLSSN